MPVCLIDEGADVVGADHAADLHHVSVGVDGDLGEDGAPGVRGEGVAIFGELGGGGGFYGCVAVAGEEGGEGFGFLRIGFEEELAIFGVNVFCGGAVEGRLRVGDGELDELEFCLYGGIVDGWAHRRGCG